MDLLGSPSGRGFPCSQTESLRPAEPPFSKEKLLVGVFGVQVVEPLLWVLRSGRKSPPAARCAPRLHAAAICGLSHSHPPRPESPSRGAGRTMELRAGPAGAARPRRRPSARLAVPGAEADRRTGGGGRRGAHPVECEGAQLRFGTTALVLPPPPPESSLC